MFSWNRFIAVLVKEFVQMRRDRLTFAMMVGVPVMQLVLFGFAINMDPKSLPMAVVSAESSPYSRTLVRTLEAIDDLRATLEQTIADLLPAAATLTSLTVAQVASIANAKAKFTVAGYPTNLSYGWKAYAATGLTAALSVAVGDTFDNGTGETHEAFAAQYDAATAYAAVNAKYFQVIYVDAAGKIRGTGNVAIATTIS